MSRSVGFNVALPVQSIPIGLNFLDSSATHGAITVADSRTYGLDVTALQTAAQEWAATHAGVIRQFVPIEDSNQHVTRFYLRVASRVYLTSRVNIALLADDARAGGVTAGIPRPVDRLNVARAGNQATQNFDPVNQIISRNLSTAQLTTQPGAAAPTTEPAGSGEEAPAPDIMAQPISKVPKARVGEVVQGFVDNGETSVVSQQDADGAHTVFPEGQMPVPFDAVIHLSQPPEPKKARRSKRGRAK